MSNIDLTRIVTADQRATLTLQAHQRAARRRVVESLDRMAVAQTGDVPTAEGLSWGDKARAAEAVLANSADPAQLAMLEAEAAETGEVLSDLAARIKARADQFRATAGRIAGIRRTVNASIGAAGTPAEVEAVIAAFETALVS